MEGTLKPASTPSPVLCYGPRKAGTTLLQSLLDGAEGLVMFPGELKLKKAICLKPGESFPEFYLKDGRSYFGALLERAGGGWRAREDFHFGTLTPEQTRELCDVDAYVRGLAELGARPSLTLAEALQADASAFLGALRDPSLRECRWAAKEVGGDPRGILEAFRTAYPRGAVVYAVREPAFVVRSIILDRRRKGIVMRPRQILYECREAQRIVQYAAYCLQDQDVVVAYEQLTANPRNEMTHVAAALGLRPTEVLHRPTTLGVEAVVTTSSRRTTEVFQQPKDWREDLTPLEVRCIQAFLQAAPWVYRAGGKRYVTYTHLLQSLALRPTCSAEAIPRTS